MEVVVCHNNADYDALGALVAVKILRPMSLVCFPGRVNKQVKELYSLYKDSLKIDSCEHLHLQEVTHLMVVDTQDPERIGKFKAIWQTPAVKL
ncbi:MAG: hypothetical protein Q8N36_00570, partial [bacterium]|nr:hypothetical protein [bacterium]